MNIIILKNIDIFSSYAFAYAVYFSLTIIYIILMCKHLHIFNKKRYFLWIIRMHFEIVFLNKYLKGIHMCTLKTYKVLITVQLIHFMKRKITGINLETFWRALIKYSYINTYFPCSHITCKVKISKIMESTFKVL